jgi:hypothetical protein
LHATHNVDPYHPAAADVDGACTCAPFLAGPLREVQHHTQASGGCAVQGAPSAGIVLRSCKSQGQPKKAPGAECCSLLQVLQPVLPPAAPAASAA